MTRKTCLLFLIFALSTTASATLRHVPADYGTIQSAIDVSSHADTVLVAHGTYFENINFRGRNIVVTSQYIFSANPADIAATVINGSQPIHTDTGSCVLIISHEDSTAVLEGFTLTGGTGTPLVDQDNHLTYVEGGGIMIENSSPIIRHNIIINNEAYRRPAGITSAGGGGIRAGFGRPRIEHNVIMRNKGRYGGGIVINFAVATIRNNVICQNFGGIDYGGSGLWIYGSDEPTIVENNTIVGNLSALSGGGIRAWDNPMTGRNNIVWGNRAATGGSQVSGNAAETIITYSCIQDGWAGDGNIDVYPDFTDANFILAAGSPCIDTGDPAAAYNDPDDTRNDMGAYGGPLAGLFPSFSIPGLYIQSTFINFGTGGPETPVERALGIRNFGAAPLRIDSVRVREASPDVVSVTSFPASISPGSVDSIRLVWTAVNNQALLDTLYIFHNDTTSVWPASIAMRGLISTDVPEARGGSLPTEFRLYQNYPNPFNAVTEIRFDLPESARVKLSIYDIQGKQAAALLDEFRSAGIHIVEWNAADMPSGTYVIRLLSDTYEGEKTITLIK